MDKFLFKLCAYALLGIVAMLIIWRFAWYATIGLIVFGFFYFGLRSIRNKFKRKRYEED